MTQIHDCCPSPQGIGKDGRKSREFPHESGRHLIAMCVTVASSVSGDDGKHSAKQNRMS